MIEKKETSRTLQATRTKEKIFKDAIKLFAKFGYKNVSIKDICDKSKVSVGVFYHYFNSKADIITILLNQRDQELLQYVGEHIGCSTEFRIMKLMSHYAQIISELGVQTISVLYNPENIPARSEGVLSCDIGIVTELITHIITQGEEIGDVTRKNRAHLDKPMDDTSRYIAIAIRGLIYDWCRNSGDYDLEEAMQEYIPSIICGFLET